MWLHSNLNDEVPAATLTNAFTINVLLAILDQDIDVTTVVHHCDAVQLIASVSAVVVQSGATVVSAVTVVAHVFIQFDWSRALGFNQY